MPINNFKEDEETKQVLKAVTTKRLLLYMAKYRKEVFTVLVLMFVILAVTVTNPLLIKYAIDNFIQEKRTEGLIYIENSSGCQY